MQPDQGEGGPVEEERDGRPVSLTGRMKSSGPPSKAIEPHSSCQNVIDRPRYSRTAAAMTAKITKGVVGPRRRGSGRLRVEHHAGAYNGGDDAR